MGSVPIFAIAITIFVPTPSYKYPSQSAIGKVTLISGVNRSLVIDKRSEVD